MRSVRSRSKWQRPYKDMLLSTVSIPLTPQMKNHKNDKGSRNEQRSSFWRLTTQIQDHRNTRVPTVRTWPDKSSTWRITLRESTQTFVPSNVRSVGSRSKQQRTCEVMLLCTVSIPKDKLRAQQHNQKFKTQLRPLSEQNHTQGYKMSPKFNHWTIAHFIHRTAPTPLSPL